MNGLQFTSSLITGLAWPLVVVCIAIVFRRPLAQLLGRIKSYKGLGHELTFGDRLADAEDSVKEAARGVPSEKTGTEQIVDIEPSPLAREADANPSFVVIRSWEQVVSALNDLAGIAGISVGNPRSRNVSSALLRDLRKFELINPEFVTAVTELRDLRNKVAHGEHNPTPGEAAAYAESAQVLSATALMMAEFVARNRQADRSFS